MGSKKKSPRRKTTCSQKRRFPLGELSKQKAILRDEYLSKSKELCSLKKKIRRLQEKSDKVKECINSLDTTLPVQPRLSAFEISKNTSTRRKKDPSELSNEGKLNLPRRSAQRRQLETLQAAAEINGGTVENRGPALDGMISTVLKYGKITDITKYFCSSKKMKKAALVKIKAETERYEKSNENFIRSLPLLYAGGIIGKVKYEQGRSALVMKHTEKTTKKGSPSKQRITFGFGIPIPRPVAYKDLIHKITEIDIGELISVRETLCATLPPEQKVAGVYRDLEKMLLILSKFYLETDPMRKDDAFKVAIGGDDAPFGKWDESMSWLVSFINVGARVASPNDNFLLFGANCKEDHPAVRLFTKQSSSKI